MSDNDKAAIVSDAGPVTGGWTNALPEAFGIRVGAKQSLPMVRPGKFHVGNCHRDGDGVAPAADEVTSILCLQCRLRHEFASGRPVVLLLLPTEGVQGTDDRNDDEGERLST